LDGGPQPPATDVAFYVMYHSAVGWRIENPAILTHRM
jgi:hypothetical protein